MTTMAKDIKWEVHDRMMYTGKSGWVTHVTPEIIHFRFDDHVGRYDVGESPANIERERICIADLNVGDELVPVDNDVTRCVVTEIELEEMRRGGFIRVPFSNMPGCFYTYPEEAYKVDVDGFLIHWRRRRKAPCAAPIDLKKENADMTAGANELKKQSANGGNIPFVHSNGQSTARNCATDIMMALNLDYVNDFKLRDKLTTLCSHWIDVESAGREVNRKDQEWFGQLWKDRANAIIEWLGDALTPAFGNRLKTSPTDGLMGREYVCEQIEACVKELVSRSVDKVCEDTPCDRDAEESWNVKDGVRVNVVIPSGLRPGEGEATVGDPKPLPEFQPRPCATTSHLDDQIGGNHYCKMAIQPVEFAHANNLGYFEATAIAYLCRWRDKGGFEDLRKAIHFVQMLIELEVKKAAAESETPTQSK